MADKKSILQRMYLDPFFFAQVLFGDKTNPMHYHLRCKSPAFHKEIFASLLELEAGEKIAIVAPRGHAKTTLVSLIYPIYRMMFFDENLSCSYQNLKHNQNICLRLSAMNWSIMKN